MSTGNRRHKEKRRRGKRLLGPIYSKMDEDQALAWNTHIPDERRLAIVLRPRVLRYPPSPTADVMKYEGTVEMQS